jgi:hypothetical protein
MITPDRLDSWRRMAALEGGRLGRALRDACSEIGRLRDRWESSQSHAGELIDRAERAEGENARLTAKLNAIAKLHDHVPLCVECREIQPCDTLAIIDGGGS